MSIKHTQNPLVIIDINDIEQLDLLTVRKVPPPSTTLERGKTGNMTLEFEIDTQGLSGNNTSGVSFLKLGASQGYENTSVSLGVEYRVDDHVTCQSSSYQASSFLFVKAVCSAITNEAMDERFLIWVNILGVNTIASTTFVYEPPVRSFNFPPFKFRRPVE